MKLCIYGASSSAIDAVYTDTVYALGKTLGQRGHSLIFGGGAHGLMGAAARGTADGGGEVIGVAPRFFDRDGILWENCTQLILTDTMRQRKQKMEELADGFLMVPGGIGTYEEFFEILTLKQLGRHSKPIALLNVAGYFDPLEDMLSATVRKGFMKPACLQLYAAFSDAESALSYFEHYSAPETGWEGLKYP